MPTVEPTASPTALPTLIPTCSPSELPTVQPSRRPTQGPTLAPSRVPTVMPSFIPTAIPVSAAPIVSGTTSAPTTSLPTFSPTLRPTAAPTNNYPLLSSNMLRSIQSNIGVNDSAEIIDRANYFEADVNVGTTTTCSAWSSWISSSLSAASYKYRPASITWWRAADVLKSTSETMTSVTCSGMGESKAILSQLISSTTTISKSAEVSSSIYSTTCGGSVWKVATCVYFDSSTADTKTLVPYLCVDCEDPCSEVTSASVLSLASCSALSSSRSTYGVNALSVAYKELAVPPIIRSVKTIGMETELKVNVTLDVDGMVYVGLFAESASAPTSVDEIVLQNRLVNTKDNFTEVTISNLQPVSRYKIYVAAKSNLGAISSVTDMLQTERKVRTSCCRKIVVTMTSSTISEGTDMVNFLTVVVPPTSDYSFSLTLQAINNETSTVLSPFVPSVLSIPMVSGSASSSFTYRAALSKLSAGDYWISVVPVGSSVSTEYAVLYSVGGSLVSSSRGIALSVLSQESPLPAPILSQAVFSNDASYVSITFDRNTNRGDLSSSTSSGSSFTCSSMFEFTCAESARCQWVDAATVYAYVPNKDSCAGINADVKLKSTATIRAQCPSASGCTTQAKWPVADVTKVLAIKAPSNPISPSIAISSPSVLGSCTSLTLDLSSSTGNGGRSWQNVSVTVVSMDGDGNTANSTALQEFLSTKFTISPPSAISADYFFAGQSYNFVVKLCNFFGQCSQSSKRVTVLSTLVPTISIPGASLRTMKRSQSLSVSSVGSIKQCGSSTSYIPLQYSWSIYKGKLADVSLVSSSKDPSRLLLPAYALQMNTLYRMEVTVTALSQSATTSLQVYVGSGDLTASLTGGVSGRNMRPSEILTLDGSKSFDEDVEGLFGQNAGLTFTWTCVQLQPTLSSDCAAVFDQTLFSASASKEIVQLQSLSSAADALAQVTLTVTDSTGSRSSSVSVQVQILPALAPTLTLLSNIASSSKMNSGKSLQLTAMVNIPATVQGSLSWSADAVSSDELTAKALTSLSQSFSASASPQTITMYLVLPGNVLSGGSTYSFTLACNLLAPGVSASSAIAVSVNAPPSPGSFSVSPREQEELQDPFLFLCSNWQDTDLPLSYAFSYYSSSSKSQIGMRSKSELTYASISLPAGPAASNYSVQAVADIFDSLAASSTSSDWVQIYPKPEMSATELTAFLGSSMDMLSSATDVDVIKQQSAVGSYLLNKVNCTLAPDCAALNRGECYRTAQTCGSCLSTDLIGDAGDSNNPCLSMDTVMSIVNAISSDTDDVSSLPEEWLSLLVSQKSCSSDCSSHGTCQYRMYDTMELVADCSLLSLDCFAECACDVGYEGTSNCGLTDEELAARNNFRSQMITGIVALTGLEDNTEENVLSWVNAMNEAAVKSDELSEDSAFSMLSFVNSTMGVVDELGMSTSSMSGMLDTMYTVSEVIVNQQAARRRRRRLQTEDSESVKAAVNAGSQVLDVLQTFGRVASSSMIPGQFPESQSSDYFHMQYGAYEVQTSPDTPQGMVCDKSVTMELPQSAREKALGYTPNKMIVPTCRDEMTQTNLAATSISSQLYGSSVAKEFDSNPLSLHLSSFPCNNEHAENCKVLVVLQRSTSSGSSSPLSSAARLRRMRLSRSNRLKPADSTQVVEEKVVMTCEEGFIGEVAHTCPNGLNVTATCDGTASTVETKCPVKHFEPSCSMLTGTQTGGNSCHMVNYTATNITCACSLLPPSSFTPSSAPTSGRRWLLSSSTTNSSVIPQGEYAVNYVSMLLAVTDTFEKTVLSAASLNANSIKKGWQAFLVIGVFTFLILGLMVVSHLLDKTDKAEIEKLEQQENARKNMVAAAAKAASTEGGPPSQLQRISSMFFDRSTKIRTTSIEHIKDALKTVGSNASGSINFLKVAEQALPQVLSSRSFVSRYKDELKRHHRWAGVLFHFSKKFPRVLRVVSLATNIIVMLFIQSITYDLTKGDDGSCELLHSEVSCLEPSSAYATGASKCYWVVDESSKYGGDCHFVQPDNDLKVIIFVAVFSAIVSTPIALAADWLIKNVLSAPTVKKPRKSKKTIAPSPLKVEESKMDSIVINTDLNKGSPVLTNNRQIRRKNFTNLLTVTTNVSDEATKNANETTMNLQREIKAYREQLKDPAMRKEYDGKYY